MMTVEKFREKRAQVSEIARDCLHDLCAAALRDESLRGRYENPQTKTLSLARASRETEYFWPTANLLPLTCFRELEQVGLVEVGLKGSVTIRGTTIKAHAQVAGEETPDLPQDFAQRVLEAIKGKKQR